MTDKEVMQIALETAEQIASADYRHWEELASLGEFERWARSRANHIAEALRARLAQPENEFNPDWDAIAVMVEEQQRMAKRIEELEARLAQPEQKLVVKLKELLEVQGRDGTWNYDPYFHGMYNGMEVMLAVLENREPVFRGAPKKWLSKKEWQGLTDEEVKILATQGRTDFSRPVYNEFYSAIEAKLKEKNGG
jgi:hypothetical protein